MYARRSERVDVHAALPRLLLTHARMATKSSSRPGWSAMISVRVEIRWIGSERTVAGSRSGAGKMQREVRTEFWWRQNCRGPTETSRSMHGLMTASEIPPRARRQWESTPAEKPASAASRTSSTTRQMKSRSMLRSAA